MSTTEPTKITTQKTKKFSDTDPPPPQTHNTENYKDE